MSLLLRAGRVPLNSARRVATPSRNVQRQCISSRSISTASEHAPLSLASPTSPSSPIHFSTPIPPSHPLLTASPAPFLFYPAFLNAAEQNVLLAASLTKLDGSLSLSRETRKRRREWERVRKEKGEEKGAFLPDEMYDFEEGHFDGVIHDYREMHLTSWPSDGAVSSLLAGTPSSGPTASISPASVSLPPLSSIIYRLETLFLTNSSLSQNLPSHSSPPSGKIQTHLLHLASRGAIGSHVDNLDASGSIIMGISLGSPRVLRMVQRATRPSSESEGRHEPEEMEGGLKFEVLLEPGSVYIQRDAVRYEFDHAITGEDTFKGKRIAPGQRLSIMMRDLKESVR